MLISPFARLSILGQNIPKGDVDVDSEIVDVDDIVITVDED